MKKYFILLGALFFLVGCDNEPPVINLIGSSTINMEVNSTYNELYATVIDNSDEEIEIQISNDINEEQVGTYYVKYNATDSSGNDATEVTRTVNITDTTIPVINLNGMENVDIIVNDSYEEFGAHVEDNYYNNIEVTITSDVDTSVIGTYYVKYNAVDASGNKAEQKIRSVNVISRPLKLVSEDYTGLYDEHYSTLNYLVNSDPLNDIYTANFIDGLIEFDKFGRMEPALAESWDIIDNADGTQTWRFYIRQKVWWVDRDGDKVAEVTSNDWVASSKWILNTINHSNLNDLLTDYILGASDYYYKKNTDFNTVGIKAPSKYVLEYTLNKPTPYFGNLLSTSAYYPVNQSYLNNIGTQFGSNGNNILYVGAYILDQDYQNNKISMKPNPQYWEQHSVNIPKITFLYNDNVFFPELERIKYENGEINSFILNEQDNVGWKKYVIGECNSGSCDGSQLEPIDPKVFVDDKTATATYFFTWNFDRQDYTSSRTDVSTHTVTKAAINNVNFRQGFLYGINRSTYLFNGSLVHYNDTLRNTYNYEGLSMDQNGVDYINHYNQVFARENKISIEEAELLNDDGIDSFLNINKAHELFKKAVSELKAAGFNNSDFPIKMELVFDYSSVSSPKMQQLIDDFNKEFAEYIQLVEIYPTDYNNYKSLVDKNSYDFHLWSAGWMPDYPDPETFLRSLVVGGEMIQYLGFDSKNIDLQHEILGEYTELVNKGSKITDINRIDERYKAFADAEYSLIWEDTLIVPFLSLSGKNLYITDVQPYTEMKAPYGFMEYKFKDKVILTEPLTRQERLEAKEQYEIDKENALNS